MNVYKYNCCYLMFTQEDPCPVCTDHPRVYTKCVYTFGYISGPVYLSFSRINIGCLDLEYTQGNTFGR